ncbi:hypothetical protein Vretifemale_19087 [Volvox reticuliferus]|uniref:Uncharacterized protein n=1 Tax=Volvox reticuliferus TaxID=1737510 RepID=A0A8J4FYR3_9CHLO|nr:hypothetical protein Vretifemale_19087 [Volvox reticuliferus]
MQRQYGEARVCCNPRSARSEAGQHALHTYVLGPAGVNVAVRSAPGAARKSTQVRLAVVKLRRCAKSGSRCLKVKRPRHTMRPSGWGRCSGKGSNCIRGESQDDR